MAKYTGKTVTVNHPAQEIFDKVSNMSSFQERIDSLPQEAREKLGEVKFTDDRIIINAPGVGELNFKVVERESPTLIRLEAENSPVPFYIIMNFKAVNETTTDVTTSLDVEIPAMLRPLIGGKMQQAADKFSEMFSNLFNH